EAVAGGNVLSAPVPGTGFDGGRTIAMCQGGTSVDGTDIPEADAALEALLLAYSQTSGADLDGVFTPDPNTPYAPALWPRDGPSAADTWQHGIYPTGKLGDPCTGPSAHLCGGTTFCSIDDKGNGTCIQPRETGSPCTSYLQCRSQWCPPPGPGGAGGR